ncbi:hypothetical protein Eta_002 [Serratia phage Eta]|uniref:DUF7740 domain-containing protein n=1 Tax=Serratia phage Eta TaxID=1282995 RepID=R9VWA3_9CAUD|nr:hypothetical protein Eta_002 [Serratia phage Eta]AGN89448.1 hypothetical protein Eta_002 [Serratia phage Eta]
MNSDYNFDEYYDCLMTIEIAAKMASLDRRPVNATIRGCWKVVKARMSNAKNIAIFDGLCKQPFPEGALKMLRRQLDMIASQQ